MPVPTCTDPPEPLVRRMDLASQLIAATMRGAKHEVFDMSTNGSDNAVPASLRCPRCAQPMRVVRRTPRFGGCPTCTRSNAGAVAYLISRNLGQEDGATLICFASLANRRGSAADWPLWLKAPKIDRFGFVCPSTG